MFPTSARIAALLLLGWAAGPEPRDLVARLGAPKFADREAASAALERMGPAAIPALRAARNGSDPEVRSRADVILEAIERSTITRGATVHLEARRYLLPDLAEILTESQGTTIDPPDPNDLAPSSKRSLTLDHPEDLGFWPLMDRLNLTVQWEPEDEFRRPMFRRGSSPKLASPPDAHAPHSDHGPFRATLRPARFAAEGMPMDARMRGMRGVMPRIEEEAGLTLPIRLQAEPRLTLRSAGSPRVLEAIDERGRSVTADLRGEVDPENGQLGERAVSELIVRLRGPRGWRPPSGLRSIRGVIPVEVEARRLEPQTMPIPEAGAESRPVVTGSTTIQIFGVSNQPFAPRGSYTVDMTIRRDGWNFWMMNGRRGNMRMWNAMSSETDRLWDSIEFVDAQGVPFRGYTTRPVAADNDGIRLQVMLPSRGEDSPPVEVRVYGSIKATVEVPFTFRDVKL